MNRRPVGYSPELSSRLPFGPKTLLLGATALVLYGLSRRSRPGAVLAAASGVLAFQAAKSQSATTESTKSTFLINTSAEKAYQVWRNFENLPRFAAHLTSVRMLDATHSEWLALAPLGRKFCWRAEIVEDQPNQRIVWRSLPGSDIQTTGSVEFRPDPQSRGTFVTAEVKYGVPGGPFGSGLASLFGRNPQFTVREALRKFKAFLEAGEIPTTIGQTHGPRGAHGHVEQALFRETSNQPQPQAGPFSKTA